MAFCEIFRPKNDFFFVSNTPMRTLLYARTDSVELLAVRWPACLQNQSKVSAIIDPSRPLSSSFLLCNACLSVCLSALTRRQKRRDGGQIGVKIGVQNRPKIAPEIDSGRPKRPRDSQGRSGASKLIVPARSRTPRGTPKMSL